MADGRRARFTFTGAEHGDMRPDVISEQTRRRLVTHPSVSLDWTWMNQVHRNGVLTVGQPGEHAGAEADAAVTSTSGAVITVRTADCAPIALVAHGGAVGVVHAGWRGLMEGVVEHAVAKLLSLAEGPVSGWLGPCIHAECYEFSPVDLQAVVDRFGASVAATTAEGQPALDLPAAVVSALDRCGVRVNTKATACTACGGEWYSHRARADSERQMLAAWIEPTS